MSTETEVVIIGAGPSGLFQVFELGLLGIQSHVVDSLPNIGGQCSALYPNKPIYDIPALPVCGAQELVDRLKSQISPFNPVFHLHQEVVELRSDAADSFYLKTAAGTEFLTQAIVIAGGLGSFQPRPLRLPGIEHHANKNLHYKVLDRNRFKDQRMVILGGGDSALDWALDLRTIAETVTLIHRREKFRAAPASVAKLKLLANANNTKIDYRIAPIKGFIESHQRLSGLRIEHDDRSENVMLDELLVCYGLSPNLGPIGNWGLAVNQRQIAVDTETFETNIPGIFAIGDINTYPGKKKLILSGFHEAALASFAIHRRVRPQAKVRLQYTTTSPLLHQRLGLKQAV